MDVTTFIIDCLTTCSFPPGLNDTNIVLILKKQVPEPIVDLRPIVLCNVVYKIMEKVLTNRMKGMLDSVVLESQSAFVRNRLI